MGDAIPLPRENPERTRANAAKKGTATRGIKCKLKSILTAASLSDAAKDAFCSLALDVAYYKTQVCYREHFIVVFQLPSNQLLYFAVDVIFR